MGSISRRRELAERNFSLLEASEIALSACAYPAGSTYGL